MTPMRSLSAISLSAAAISSACMRLSSWHGPANSASGRRLETLTLPILTTGFGDGLAEC